MLRLQNRVPRNIAREFALAEAPVDAATAARWGLFNRIAPAGKSVEVALELAEQVATGAPLSLNTVKQILSWGRSRRLGRERQGLPALLASGDAKEGPRTFAEKRAPHWTGR